MLLTRLFEETKTLYFGVPDKCIPTLNEKILGFEKRNSDQDAELFRSSYEKLLESERFKLYYSPTDRFF